MTAREQDGVLLMALTGRLDSNTSAEFEERLLGEIRAGRRRIVLNFGELEYISSAGLRVLLKAARELGAHDGVLVLCCLRDYIREVFDLSGFTGILAVKGREDEALDHAR